MGRVWECLRRYRDSRTLDHPSRHSRISSLLVPPPLTLSSTDVSDGGADPVLGAPSSRRQECLRIEHCPRPSPLADKDCHYGCPETTPLKLSRHGVPGRVVSCLGVVRQPCPRRRRTRESHCLLFTTTISSLATHPESSLRLSYDPRLCLSPRPPSHPRSFRVSTTGRTDSVALPPDSGPVDVLRDSLCAPCWVSRPRSGRRPRGGSDVDTTRTRGGPRTGLCLFYWVKPFSPHTFCSLVGEERGQIPSCKMSKYNVQWNVF